MIRSADKLVHNDRLGRRLGAILFITASYAVPTLAATPAQQCASTKLMVSGKKAANKLICHSKGLRQGQPPDADCLLKAEERFSGGFQKLDARGSCVSTGDAGAIETLVDAVVAQVSAALNPSLTSPTEQKCASKKLKASAMAAQAKLKCHTKSTRYGVAVDEICLSRANQSFNAMFLRQDTTNTCAVSGDAMAIAEMIDDFASAVVSAIPTVPPAPTATATDTATATPTVTPTVTPTTTPTSAGSAGTPTSSPTGTPTSCRGDLPVVEAVMSPTNQTTQIIHVCGRNVASSQLSVHGPGGTATDLGFGSGCGPCPNPGNASCYDFSLPLVANSSNTVTACQFNGTCPSGGCVTDDRNGNPLVIVQSP